MSAGAFTHAKDMTYRRAGRWGGDFRLDMNHYFARFEGTLAHDSGANSEAGTLDLGYNCPTTFFQPVVRIDYFETTAITTWAHTVGLGYLFNNNGNKIQLAYTHLNNGGGGLGSYVQQPDTKQSLLVLNFQAAI
jgi:hypothetical protein